MALQLGHKLVLLDERDARLTAKTMGLTPVGVLGVLLRAKREGALDSVESAMLDLQQRAGFTSVLVSAGER